MLNLKNTLDGYLKNVEVIGNTIQDENNLADIRSVGDKVEGQELYKIDVVSCGKNLLNIEDRTHTSNGVTFEYSNQVITLSGTSTGNYVTSPFISVKNILQDGKCYRLTSIGSDAKVVPAFRYVDETNTQQWVSKILWKSSYSKPFVYVQVQNSGTNCNGYKIKLQLEEITDLNTDATSYEPYQENKLEILSPVQLEKVGDVADRIICKDGVWGVEKNINNIYPTFTYNTNHLGFNFYKYTLEDITDTSVPTKIYFLSNHNVVSFEDRFNNINEGDIYISTSKWVYVSSKLSSEEIKEIYDGKVLIKYPTLKPQFIPLPHDQQVKLRTFAGQTNIAFLTEIPGQIKAQVPKSLGATVNTHTEQIADLHNSLERVKKLEETTVSTVETESSFTTVDATNNGYFEDVKLEGKTLVNLVTIDSYTYNDDMLRFYIKDTLTKGKTITLFNPTDKTIRVEIGCAGVWKRQLFVYPHSSKVDNMPSDEHIVNISAPKTEGWLDSEKDKFKKCCLVLEGDYTQNPPEYFEGLMSVGQDVEEVSVESVYGDGNLVIDDNINLYTSRYNAKVEKTPEGIRVFNRIAGNDRVFLQPFRVKKNSVVNISCDVKVDTEGSSTLFYISFLDDNFNVVSATNFPTKTYKTSFEHIAKAFNVGNASYIRIELVCFGTSSGATYKNIMVSNSSKSYIPYQTNKKPLLYYNSTTETWEKPVLREWDTIEKHSDGKYYYHKRSGEVVLNGSENWNNSSVVSADTVRFVISLGDNKHNVAPICDIFKGQLYTTNDVEGAFIGDSANLGISILKTKLSTQDIAGFKAWLKANPTTVVYKLAKEEVYECANIDLMTYSGETNYIINSGAISPKSLLKVHNNISNVVKILQEKVSLLENTFIAGLRSVLSGDMYSLATILYPEDFEQNDNTEQDIMVIPE